MTTTTAGMQRTASAPTGGADTGTLHQEEAGGAQVFSRQQL